MSKNLKSRAEFAAIVNMQYRYVKRACNTLLKDAVVADKIDMDHPCVRQYIHRRSQEPSHVETDESKPMYARAVEACQKTGLWSVKNMRKNLPIGDKKAAKFLQKMKESGLIPDDYDKSSARSIAQKTVQHYITTPPEPIQHHVTTTLQPQENHVATTPEPIEDHDSEKQKLPRHIAKFAHKSLYELIDIFGSDVAFLEWLRCCKMMEEVTDRQRKNAEAMNLLVNQEVFKAGIFEPMDMFLKQILTDGADNIVQRLMAQTKAGCTDVECKKYFIDVINSFIRPMKKRMKNAFKEVEIKD